MNVLEIVVFLATLLGLTLREILKRRGELRKHAPKIGIAASAISLCTVGILLSGMTQQLLTLDRNTKELAGWEDFHALPDDNWQAQFYMNQSEVYKVEFGQNPIFNLISRGDGDYSLYYPNGSVTRNMPLDFRNDFIPTESGEYTLIIHNSSIFHEEANQLHEFFANRSAVITWRFGVWAFYSSQDSQIIHPFADIGRVLSTVAPLIIIFSYVTYRLVEKYLRQRNRVEEQSDAYMSTIKYPSS